MKFSAVFGAALFAGLAVAAPAGEKSGGLAARVARRAAGVRASRPMNLDTEGGPTNMIVNQTQVTYSSNWAGPVLTAPPAGTTFASVYGTFTVPKPSVPSSGSSRSYSASAWVGIDGDTYGNAILQSGVDFTVSSSGAVSYDSWYEWYPDYAYDFSGFSISTGDVIAISIVSSSSTAGTVTLSNTSTGKSVSKALTAPSSSAKLGGQNAEWIVEDYESGSSLVSMANFGTVVFTGCSAKAGSQTVGLSGAQVIDIRQSGTVLTSVTINSASQATIEYV